jgi:D-beta-D-heptose 7-phosphate kinase/D-beta-D-heptose 1-phosphate adenosyltransferase
LDRFVHGVVHRISPEAPIPVVEVVDEALAPGGAANVARNIRALGGRPILVGAVGDDAEGNLLAGVLASSGMETGGLVKVPGRVTTVKTRIIAHHQQVVRVDREVRLPLPPAAAEVLGSRLVDLLTESRAVVASDYVKGVLDPSVLALLGERAGSLGIPYVVDPKPAHFPYPGATVVTPNRDETSGFIRGSFRTEDLESVAQRLLAETDWKAILFTLGGEGMALAERGGVLRRIPARAREVFDVTGAGDTVAAVVALGLAAGLPLCDAAHLANEAAGVVVGKVGTAECTPQELEAALGAEGG